MGIESSEYAKNVRVNAYCHSLVVAFALNQLKINLFLEKNDVISRKEIKTKKKQQITKGL